MILDVKKIGDPILRQRSQDVPVADILKPEIQTFIDDLIETMHAENGAGIAAIQVGKPLRIFVMEVNKNPRYPYKPQIPLTVIINPEITFLTDRQFENYEGCLSVPGLRGKVGRYLEMSMSYFDRNGEKHIQQFNGITAGTVQHEFDHLNGELFIDKVTDPKSLTTWDQFKAHHEGEFIELVNTIVNEYGS